ncbi:MAG: hypothetical protein E6G97_06155 [Alphaproteobacteria bacterium]|nr:MAG: hypothetical protein E6G97_06155 [Alphaproteobacteria bacterium]
MRTKILAALATLAFVAAVSVPETADARFGGGGFRGGGFGGGFRGGAVGFRGGMGGFRGGFAGGRLGTWGGARPGWGGGRWAGAGWGGGRWAGAGWRGGYGGYGYRRWGAPLLGAAVGLGYGAASYYPYSYGYDAGYYPSAYSSGCTCGY